MTPTATIPFDLLALTYIEAVEAGRYPSQTLRRLFGFSIAEMEERRKWMSSYGWLPKGSPVLDGRLHGLHGPTWVARARRMVGAKLQVRLDYLQYQENKVQAVAKRCEIRQERADVLRLARLEKNRLAALENQARTSEIFV